MRLGGKEYRFKTDNKMKWLGDTNVDTGVIKINKKKNHASKQRGEMLDSIVHEMTHARHPKMHERAVQKKTEKLDHQLSKKEKKKIYSLV